MLPFNLGLPEMVIILVVAVVLFGGKLPEVSRSIGKGLREFQRGFREIKDEIDLEPDLGSELRQALPHHPPETPPTGTQPREDHPGDETPEDPLAAQHSEEPSGDGEASRAS